MTTCEYSFSDSSRTVLKSYRSILPPEKRALREHRHTECELSVFLKGSGVYTVGEEKYVFRAGDAFLFSPDEEHCITEIAEPMELLNVRFEPRLVWEESELLELLFSRKKGYNKFENDTHLEKLLLLLEGELREKRICYATNAKCLLFSALIHIAREYDCIDVCRVLKTERSQAKAVRRALDYINENLEKRITLDDLAGLSFLSAPYFSTLFKRYNGINVSEYITIKRVQHALELLKTTDMTKLEIAALSGFSSLSNFYKAFSRVTGKTPSDIATRSLTPEP